jgi:hypothetical protein
VPQTVFDVGDPLTSVLDLGVAPGGDTVVTLTVTGPAGQNVTVSPGAFVGNFKTAQWYATDNGAAGGTITPGVADGDWLAVWRVTGTGASVTAKVYPVRPLPSASSGRPPWAPFLSDVADHVPWLTVDTVTPGSQVYLGTFTGRTTPTDEQVQRHIDQAVSIVGAGLGTLPASMYRMARGVAAIRAASTVALAFPRSRADLDTADRLAVRAASDLTVLTAAAEVAGSSPPASPAPVMYAPESPWYADLDL